MPGVPMISAAFSGSIPKWSWKALSAFSLGVHDDGDAGGHQAPRLGQRAEGEVLV